MCGPSGFGFLLSLTMVDLCMWMCSMLFQGAIIKKACHFSIVGFSPRNAFSECYQMIRAAPMLYGLCLKCLCGERK